MEIPDTISNFLKPLAPVQLAGDHQLPPNLSRQFDSIINHFQNKQGNIILFSGASNAVNTLSANLLAKQMKVDVYRVDLSAVVSKYIGETEKNLLQVFEFVGKQHFILFFDDADGMLTRRTGASDSHDRYANLDIEYLLKRIEAHSGIAIIATNMRDSLDSRLLDAAPWQINFTKPVIAQPLPWWQRLFGWLLHRK